MHGLILHQVAQGDGVGHYQVPVNHIVLAFLERPESVFHDGRVGNAHDGKDVGIRTVPLDGNRRLHQFRNLGLVTMEDIIWMVAWAMASVCLSSSFCACS